MGYHNLIAQGWQVSGNGDFNIENGTCSRQYTMVFCFLHCTISTEQWG